MIRSRLRLKALGLCAMMLVLMAFSAAGAQAESTARWWVNGATVDSTGLSPTLEVKELENKTVSLLTEIAGAKVEYLCTEAKLIAARLEKEGRISAGFKFFFHGCVTRLNGVLSPVCVPKTTGQPNGLVLTEELKGLLQLHNGKDVVRISPVSENLRFGVVRHTAPCVLPETVPVFGHLVIHDPVDEALLEEVDHLFLQHSLTHLWVISLTPEHAANIDGSFIAALGGVHKGMKWKGVPG